MSRSKRRSKQHPSPLYRPDKASDGTQNTKVGKTAAGWLPPALGIVLVLIAGVVYGLQTDRWIPSQEVDEAAARLQHIPVNFGRWKGEDLPVSQREMEQAGAAGYLCRVYTNKEDPLNPKVVHVMILCGRHGPISLHPPTVCFKGAGWALEEEPKPTVIKKDAKDKHSGRFFVSRWRKGTPLGFARMRTCWAWNADGTWESPDEPRFAFAGAGHLYKIYVSTRLSADASTRPSEKKEEREKLEEGACAAFIRDFIPILKKAGI